MISYPNFEFIFGTIFLFYIQILMGNSLLFLCFSPADVQIFEIRLVLPYLEHLLEAKQNPKWNHLLIPRAAPFLQIKPNVSIATVVAAC